jgi:hypothetical protein
VLKEIFEKEVMKEIFGIVFNTYEEASSRAICTTDPELLI